jgi:hypothetical protein
LRQLVREQRCACAPYQSIRLFQNVCIRGLFSRNKADSYEERTEHQPYQHDLAVGASVSVVEGPGHSKAIQLQPSIAIELGI